MKLLYLSCHSILEYDELKLFSELGIEVFSHGAYTNPQQPGDPKRPGVDLKYYPELYNLAVAYGKENLHQDMVNWADVILVQHRVDWIYQNWSKIKDKRVIWRSIGQSSLNVEKELTPLRREGLEIVRYSPREATIPGYVGEDRMIRFYKDPEEFKGWTGVDKKVITIGQSMKDRWNFSNYNFFKEATEGLNLRLFGTPSKEQDELWSGQLTYEAMKQELQISRVFLYTGTYPASYTLTFIEALMTGIPIVALGPLLGNSPHEVGQQTYEIPDFSEQGANILLADDPQIARTHLEKILCDDAFASEMSKRSRETAIKYFDKEKIKNEWKEYLNV